MTTSKLKEIKEKLWFSILANQYKVFLTAKHKIKNPELFDMNTEYPLLLKFVKKILE